MTNQSKVLPHHRIHNGDKVLNALGIFGITFGAFRVYVRVISPRWPRYNRQLLIAGRRVHHYESGLYLAALGLALFLEDINDWNYDNV